MLGELRKGAKMWFVKALLFALALSFVVWGVGDVFRRGHSSYVAKVGNYGVSQAEFANSYNNEIKRFEQATGARPTDEQLKMFNLKSIVLQNIINDKLLLSRAEDLNIVLGDEVVKYNISQFPSFFDENGAFKREKFLEALERSSMSEKEFVASVKNGESTSLLTSSMAIPSLTSNVEAKYLLKFEKEKRVVDVISLSKDYPTQNIEPTEEELLQFYKDNQDSFSVPEIRSFSYIVINPKNVDIGSAITDAEIEKYYNDNLAEFSVPEKRAVSQYLFSDSISADKAYQELLASGKTSGDLVDMGEVTADSLPKNLSQAVFSLKQGEFSKPISSDLGIHIFKVTKVIEPAAFALADVKEEIRNKIISSHQLEKFDEFLNKIEDEFAAGSSVAEIAAKHKFELAQVADVTLEGKDKNDQEVALSDDAKFLLPTVFEASVGVESSPIAMADKERYVIFKVDNNVPARVKALDEAKGKAITLWKEQNKKTQINKVAESILAKLKQNTPINKVLEDRALMHRESVNIDRSSKDFDISVLNQIYKMDKNTWSNPVVSSDGSLLLLKVNSTILPDEIPNSEIASLQSTVNRERNEDLLVQYFNFLAAKYDFKDSDVNYNLINNF